MQGDLVYTLDIRGYDEGITYLLIAIDVFSRFMYAGTLKDKMPLTLQMQ